MSKDVTPFSSNAPVASDMVSAIQNQANKAPAVNRMPFLRLMKSGEWVYGADDVVVEEGSRWMVHPGTFQHGYCAWGNEGGPKQGVLCGEHMVPVNRDLPPMSSMDHIEDAKWAEQIAMQLVCVSGEDEGTNVLYKTSSLSGRSAFQSLCQAIATQAADNPEEIFPVVELRADSYRHKRYGQIMTPEFEVVGFSDGGTLPEAEEEEEAPPPKKRGTSKKTEAAGKKRRRRRRTAA